VKTNHKDLHRKLEDLGYSVYVLDYKSGTHYYQFEKQGLDDWNEYGVDTKKKIITASVNQTVLPLLKDYYEKQGYTIEEF